MSWFPSCTHTPQNVRRGICRTACAIRRTNEMDDCRIFYDECSMWCNGSALGSTKLPAVRRRASSNMFRVDWLPNGTVFLVHQRQYAVELPNSDHRCAIWIGIGIEYWWNENLVWTIFFEHNNAVHGQRLGKEKRKTHFVIATFVYGNTVLQPKNSK